MLGRRRKADAAAAPASAGSPLVDPSGAAPDVPAGWITGPPDYVGVAAQRCGTSWWASLIAAHPGVSRPDGAPKEVHFFDRFHGEAFTDDRAAEYATHFPRRPGSVTGEWTPRYAFDFWTPPLLARAAPDARLLVMVRDPVTRYRSGVAHMWWLDAPAWFIASDAFERGRYHEQLARLFTAFPREQVLVLQYERCVRDTDRWLRATYDHLGLDWHPPGDVDARVNESVPEDPLPEDLVARLRELYEPENELLAALVDVDLDLWR